MRGTGKSFASAFLTLAFASAALPAMAAPACGPLQIIMTLPLTPLGSPDNVRTVPMTVVDSPRNFLVDTGAFTSFIGKHVVDEQNLPTMRTVDGSGGISVNGTVSDQMARPSSITLGNIKQENPYFLINLSGDRDFDGLLGTDLLRNFDVDFDFTANKLNLISQNHCPGNVTYWKASALAVVPFTLYRNHIMIRVEVDGRRVNSIIDTGATNTNLNLDFARRNYRIDLDSPDVEKAGELTGGYTATIYSRRFKSVAFEGVVVTNPIIRLLPDMMTQGAQAPRIGSLIAPATGAPGMIIGMNVLSKLHLYIAYKERKLYITEAAAAAQ